MERIITRDVERCKCPSARYASKELTNHFCRLSSIPSVFKNWPFAMQNNNREDVLESGFMNKLVRVIIGRSLKAKFSGL